MEYHEAANLFPIDDENVQSLADDIRENGQITPIEIMDGKILDGRRRWAACQIAGVEPETTEVCPSDPVAYALSLNLHRRHLNPSQKAMVAARAREIYDQQAKERQQVRKGNQPGATPENLPDLKQDARDAAGKAVGVSGKTVDFATKVLTQGTPELVKAVDEGRMAVSTAAVYSSEPPEEQDRVANEPKRRRKYKPAPGGGNDVEEAKSEEPPPGESRGVGVTRAHEAIACLKRIPKSDGLRKRGFQIVMDYIRHNQRG